MIDHVNKLLLDIDDHTLKLVAFINVYSKWNWLFILLNTLCVCVCVCVCVGCVCARSHNDRQILFLYTPYNYYGINASSACFRNTTFQSTPHPCLCYLLFNLIPMIRSSINCSCCSFAEVILKEYSKYMS